MTIATIVFVAGGVYSGIKHEIATFRRDFDTHRAESATWRAKLEATLFGADGRNGLVGDTIKHGEHIKHCIFATRNGDRDHG